MRTNSCALNSSGQLARDTDYQRHLHARSNAHAYPTRGEIGVKQNVFCDRLAVNTSNTRCNSARDSKFHFDACAASVVSTSGCEFTLHRVMHTIDR